MVKMYKLVNQDYTTHNGMKWEIGKTNQALGVGTEMCTNQVLHCYKSPEQAVLFNSRHANIKNPILLEIECDKIVNSDGLKYASKEQTPTKITPLPIVTTKQRVAIAIKLALLDYKLPKFVQWAEAWLDGTDRSITSAREVRDADADAYAVYAYAYAAAAAAAADADAYAVYAYAYAAAAARTKITCFPDKLQEIIVWVMDNIN